MKILEWFHKIKYNPRMISIAAVWVCYCLALVLGFSEFGPGWGESKYTPPTVHSTVTTTKYKGAIVDMDFGTPRYARGHHSDPFGDLLIQLFILGGWALSLSFLDPYSRYKYSALTRYGFCVLLLIWTFFWHFHFLLLLSLLYLPFIFYGALKEFNEYLANK